MEIKVLIASKLEL